MSGAVRCGRWAYHIDDPDVMIPAKVSYLQIYWVRQHGKRPDERLCGYLAGTQTGENVHSRRGGMRQTVKTPLRSNCQEKAGPESP